MGLGASSELCVVIVVVLCCSMCQRTGRRGCRCTQQKTADACSLLVVDERTSSGMDAQVPLKRGSRRAFRE